MICFLFQQCQDVQKELIRLEIERRRIQIFTEHLSRENILLRPLVNNATEHAMKLKRQADLLER